MSTSELIERLKKRAATFAGRTADGVSVFVPVKEVDDAITELQRLQARNAELEAMVRWVPVSDGMKAGKYLCANIESGDVAQARWLPVKKQWKFPSAQMGFAVTHCRPLPQPPEVNSEG